MFWKNLLSFFISFVETEAAAVLPHALKAVTDLSTQELAAVQSGNTKDTGHILARVVNTAATNAFAAGVSAGAPAILAAAAHALASPPVAPSS